MTDRHKFRADWHDYNDGIFFVTVCCANRKNYFGMISDEEMRLSPIGRIAEECITGIPDHFADAELWNHIVMPNHIHLLLCILPKNNEGTDSVTANMGCLKPKRHDAPDEQNFLHNSRLAVIMGQLKSSVSRMARRAGLSFGWQERYNDCIVRNQHALDNINDYIDCNVERWRYDRMNPVHEPSESPAELAKMIDML